MLFSDALPSCQHDGWAPSNEQWIVSEIARSEREHCKLTVRQSKASICCWTVECTKTAHSAQQITPLVYIYREWRARVIFFYVAHALFMNVIASVTSKNFRFNSGLAINFEMMRIYAVYHAVGSIAIQPSRIKRSVHFFFGILLLLPPQLVFFSSSAVLFLVFYSRHMISLVAIVRLSLWCQNPKKIIVSFRRFGTIYIYPFFPSAN